MDRKQYIEKLRAKALDHSYTIQGEMIDEIADELEAMDVVWVPREPTEEMLSAFNSTAFMNGRAKRSLIRGVFHSAYTDMLTAAENTND